MEEGESIRHWTVPIKGETIGDIRDTMALFVLPLLNQEMMLMSCVRLETVSVWNHRIAINLLDI